MNKLIIFKLLSVISLLFFSSIVSSDGLVTGTYALKWSKKSGCAIKAFQKNSNKLQFELECDEGARGNSGLAYGVLDLKNNVKPNFKY